MKLNNKFHCRVFILKRQYIYSLIEDAEVVLVFERNNVGLKKLSQVVSEQTSDSSAFLIAMCLFKVCTHL
jgi:hypothetical protein